MIHNYPPREAPEVKCLEDPFDIQPESRRMALPIVILDQPPATVTTERLVTVATADDQHPIWRCASLIEVFLRNGMSRDFVKLFHCVVQKLPLYAQIRMLAFFSQAILDSELNSNFLASQEVKDLCYYLKLIEDFRLVEGCWLIRAYLRDSTVDQDIEYLCSVFGWERGPQNLAKQIARKSHWSPFTIQKPLADEVLEVTLPTVPAEYEVYEVMKILVEPGQDIDANETIALELETDKCIVEIPATVTGRVVEVLVRESQVVRPGDKLYRYRPIIETPTDDGR